MQSKPKSNSVLTHALNPETKQLTFKVAGAGEVVLNLSAVSERNRERATLHGLVQRISDAAAISRNTLTGKPAEPKEKFAAISELVEWFNSGAEEWRLPRSEGSGQGRGFLLNALCELYANKSREELGVWLKGRSEVEKKALENDPRIKPKIDAQRARGSEAVDTLAMLSELGE